MPGEDNHWVAIDVAADALSVTIKQAYRLSKKHHWRTAAHQYPKQYLFADITRTYRQRKGNAHD